MKVSIRFAPALLVVLLICAATAAATKLTPASGPDPATTIWTEWPHEVACEEGLPFDPVAAFSTQTGAEQGGLPSEQALRRVLTSGELAPVRPHDWRHLTETPRVAEFAAGRLFTKPGPTRISQLEWIELEKAGGRWQLAAYQAFCTPRSIRGGARATPWSLAPGQDLNQNTRRVRVDLEPQVCNPVRKARIQKPEFREQNGALLMTLWRRRGNRPAATRHLICPPQTLRIVVELPEKLGSRQLFDGGTYPPLPAAR